MIDEYAKEFGYATEIDGKLSEDYSKFHTEEYGSFTIDEIRYIVDHEDMLHKKYANIGREVINWFECVMECVEFGLHTVGLQDWLEGNQRPTPDERAHIRAIRDHLNREIERLNEVI